MHFKPTDIDGVVVVGQQRHADRRGFFARTFCSEEFSQAGLASQVLQCNVSFNSDAGTLRGMHYQAEPHSEAKLVTCLSGRMFDVAVDLRRDSPTFCQWYGAELSAGDGRALYIGEGLAHGFQTLEPETTVGYHMFSAYVPEAARGVRWDDPAFGIRWPDAVRRVISDRDQQFAALDL